mmetsp:Transcript_129033/g.350208  ORF Transcript_129033/g.350208 Transcript_129033/m.350208 type:complete len:83 (-) Transcript_129033:24-272(-)
MSGVLMPSSEAAGYYLPPGTYNVHAPEDGDPLQGKLVGIIVHPPVDVDEAPPAPASGPQAGTEVKKKKSRTLKSSTKKFGCC